MAKKDSPVRPVPAERQAGAEEAKMYSLIIPPKYLGDLVRIREKTGVSIRKQILLAIETHIIHDKNGGNPTDLKEGRQEE